MQPSGLLVELFFIWCCLGNTQDLWKDFIPMNYTNEPPLNGSTLNITVALTIVSISAISEHKLVFFSELKVILEWFDYRLVSSIVPVLKSNGDSEDDEIAYIPSMISKKIWRPKIFIGSNRQGDRKNLYTKDGQPRSDNLVVSHYFFKPNLQMRIDSSIETSCPFRFHHYPFDVQHCAIKLQFDTNTPKAVQAIFDDKSAESLLFDHSPSLKLVVFKVVRGYCPINNQSIENALCLEWKITFERRIGIYITQIFIPCTMIVVLSWFSFWLDVEAAPARISLGVTALLTLSTNLAHTQSSLPTVAYMKAIDLWMFFCIFSVFMSLVEFTCAYTLSKRSKLKKNTHTTVQKKIVNIRGKKYVFAVKPTKSTNDRNLTLIVRKVTKMSLDDIARIIFPSCFLLFSCTFMLYYWRKKQQGLDLVE